ncbi:MAG: 4-alpha-glucanotransferase [bacterium]
MKLERASGILLHPTSLPSKYGIGDFGPAARKFVDFLSSSGQKLWQMLPLQHTPAGSPYDCISAFAGNPLLISPVELIKDGFLPKKIPAPEFSSERVDFRKAGKFKAETLKRAFGNFRGSRAFELFCRKNGYWLDDYCDFLVLRDKFGYLWNSWPASFAKREEKHLYDFRKKFSEEIEEKKFIQWLFFKQWYELKKYANKKGIKIIGDVPMFVSLDSADVWAHRELFLLNRRGNPLFVSGVPPDYFSRTGQLWGNPVYNWSAMRANHYGWWRQRFQSAFEIYDVIRIDHFRGFTACWRVPARAKTALKGKWVRSPGYELFKALKKHLGVLPIIAEDLGRITSEVRKMREFFGFPGMKIFQFAFSGKARKEFLPQNYGKNCVVYTGSHDNDPVAGWLRRCSEKERGRVIGFFGGVKELNWRMIQSAMASKAVFSVFPLQDVLGLGSGARFNFPGTTGRNWRWRFDFDALTEDMTKKLRLLTRICKRD